MSDLFDIEPTEPPPLQLARMRLAQMVRDLETYRAEMPPIKVAWAEGDIRAQERLVTALEGELL